jgi:hypothetical protein
MSVVACSGAATVSPVRLEVRFGLTERLPLSGAEATDYVPNAEKVVPEVVRGCGGTDVSYHVGTDGIAAVVFTPTRPVTDTEVCIKKPLPQVYFQSPAAPR